MATYTGSDKRLAYLFEHGGGGGGSANIWTGTMAEYIAQASQIADDTAVFITDDEIQSLIVSSYDIYSTDEKEIGVWTDGKPLYKKTIKLSSPLTVNANSWATVDTLSEQINIIDAEGVYSTGAEYVYYAIGANCDTSNILTVLNYRGVYIELNYITLKYTKTSDIAGSGLFVPSGAVAHHYSTTEQVVGTWTDGKPLYEKTIDTSLSVSTGGLANITQLSNIDHLFMTEASFEESGIIYMLNEMSTRIMFDKNTGYLSLKAASGASWYGQIKITIRYTKTTD